jgi:hypothetical protein
VSLGIKQFALLHRAWLKGFVDVNDLGIFYRFKSGNRRFAVIEKLMLQGYLSPSTQHKYRWLLTEKGEEIVIERLKNA